MRILIAGGAGFLGSHLSGRLLKAGHEVIVFDDLSTGRLKNLRTFIDHKNFTFIQDDVRNPIGLKGELDGIFNLACPASPIQYQLDPIGTLRTCFEGSLNLLELAHLKKARILQASTSEIYGDPTINPQSESYRGNVNTVGARSCYDEGKRVAETLFSDYHKINSVDIRLARIFNTYGPNMSTGDGRVVSNFIVQALEGNPLTIYGNGSQTRSFCYVEDLIEGLVKLFFKEKLNTPVNLGNPQPVSILELANEVIYLTNSRSKLEFLALPEDDPVLREPDISKAIAMLDWTPKVSRQEGITNTISYFRREIDNV